MKRGLLITAACTLFITAAAAQDYTYQAPPSLAVMDFEVSMSTTEVSLTQQSAVKETREFYGELISQTLLSVLVQQNAANVVITPRYYNPRLPDDPMTVPGTPVYDPGTPDLERKLEEEGAKKRAALRKADKAAQNEAEGQALRYYIPPVFKIYDKKYVENALQNGNYTTKDLYTKAANAFAFAELDYVVLGNVYDTRYGNRDAIGINVRVLNTKRAEELYAYSAVVDQDLHDLPDACARICRSFMVDILNSHCGQFVVSKGPSFSSVGAHPEDDPKYANTLFWQPQQVRQEDGTLGAPDHSNKREVMEKQYYWILPGQFSVALYSKQNLQLRDIPFSVATGEIKNVMYETQHFDVQKGPVTVSGVAPTASYTINIKPEEYRSQYWWEIFTPLQRSGSLTVTFDNGESKVEPKDADYQVEYRPATQDLVITNVPLGAYTIQVTRNPPKGIGGIDGLWIVQTKLIIEGKTLPLVMLDTKGVKVQMADFGIQDKKAIEAPQTTKVSFVLNPGFGVEGVIQISGGTAEPDKYLYWSDKEKITITSEYGKDEWDSQPLVTYTVWVRGMNAGYPWPVWKGDTKRFLVGQIVPARDTVEIVNVGELKTAADAEAKQNAVEWARLIGKKAEPESEAATGTAQKTTLGKKTAAASKTATAAPPGGAAPATGRASKLFLNPAMSLGYGSYSYWNASSYYDYSTSTWVGAWEQSGGFDVGASTSVLYYLFPAFGVGGGLLVDYIIGSDVGFAATLNVAFGDPSKGGTIFLLDIGGGTGLTIGGGVAFMSPGAIGGLTLGGNYCYYASGWSASMSVGYMFGL
jgi:hypothetical protein